MKEPTYVTLRYNVETALSEYGSSRGFMMDLLDVIAQFFSATSQLDTSPKGIFAIIGFLLVIMVVLYFLLT